jgi:hypothetical protein
VLKIFVLAQTFMTSSFKFSPAIGPGLGLGRAPKAGEILEARRNVVQ